MEIDGLIAECKRLSDECKLAYEKIEAEEKSKAGLFRLIGASIQTVIAISYIVGFLMEDTLRQILYTYKVYGYSFDNIFLDMVPFKVVQGYENDFFGFGIYMKITIPLLIMLVSMRMVELIFHKVMSSKYSHILMHIMAISTILFVGINEWASEGRNLEAFVWGIIGGIIVVGVLYGIVYGITQILDRDKGQQEFKSSMLLGVMLVMVIAVVSVGYAYSAETNGMYSSRMVKNASTIEENSPTQQSQITYPTSYLANGDADNNKDDVMLLQSILNQLGMYETDPLVVDGIYGKQTEYAVINFQKQQNFVVTGTVDERIWKALYEQIY